MQVFCCAICHKCYGSRAALDSHTRTTTMHSTRVMPYVIQKGRDYKCEICDRWLRSDSALEMHIKTSSRHVYCERCNMIFRNKNEMTTHQRKSENHNICVLCDEKSDFPTRDQLDVHCLEEHSCCSHCHHTVSDASTLQQHFVAQHLTCQKCGEEFEKVKDLNRHHNQKHPANMFCIGCSRQYKNCSSMLDHVRSGKCQIQMGMAEIRRIAHKFHRRAEYTVPLGHGMWDFKCPACQTTISGLSALYQHAETANACSHVLEPPGVLADLRLYLAKHATPTKPL